MNNALTDNPKVKAGIFSLLTFSWMSDVLKLSSKQRLEEKHLFLIETSDQAESLVADMGREWLAEEKESEHNGTKRRLWRALMRVLSYRD